MTDEEVSNLIPPAFMESPGFLLNTAGKLLLQRVSASLKPSGLTVQEYGLLRIISIEGPVTQNAFAAKWAIDRTTVTEIVDGLEQRGVIIRLKSKADRRYNELHLTPSGKKLLARVVKIVDKANAEFLQPLDDREWQLLRDSLVKLIVASKA
ncbi:MarR family transcriptional regulator [Candidatus Obscuribacterales bacterium]|nr:MarR family transcriptional regulator [Candidatus Obscuribacterales bacterium]